MWAGFWTSSPVLADFCLGSLTARFSQSSSCAKLFRMLWLMHNWQSPLVGEKTQRQVINYIIRRIQSATGGRLVANVFPSSRRTWWGTSHVVGHVFNSLPKCTALLELEVFWTSVDPNMPVMLSFRACTVAVVFHHWGQNSARACLISFFPSMNYRWRGKLTNTSCGHVLWICN